MSGWPRRGMHAQDGAGKTRWLHILLYGALLAWTAFTVLPLLWALAGSFKPLDAVFANTVPFSWKALLPTPFTVQAYSDLLHGPFTRALLNTLFVCAVTVVLGIFVNSLGGYVFAIFRFPGSRLIEFIVLLTFLVPFEVIALPLFNLVTALRFDNTYQALILPAVANGLLVFLFRQFFAALPRDLLDAARVDGLSWIGIYTRVVLPLSVPVIISAGLVLFIAQWDAYYWPLLITTSPDYAVLQTALANYRTEHGTAWNSIFAGSVIATVVPAAVLLVLQKHYINSVASTGAKE